MPSSLVSSRRWRQPNRLAENDQIGQQVESRHIAQIIHQWTGIPVAKMLSGEQEKLLGMETRLGQRVIGQSRGDNSHCQCHAAGQSRAE